MEGRFESKKRTRESSSLIRSTPAGVTTSSQAMEKPVVAEPGLARASTSVRLAHAGRECRITGQRGPFVPLSLIVQNERGFATRCLYCVLTVLSYVQLYVRIYPRKLE